MLLADEIAHLVAEDGSRVPIDRPYVLGRDPRQDPAVRRGAASPVLIPDPEQTVSRVQAYLDIDGGVLTIRDAGSSNGTDVAAPGDAEWTRLGSEPFALPVGMEPADRPPGLHLHRPGGRTRSPDRGRPSPPTSRRHGAGPAPPRRAYRPRLTAVVAAARNSGCDPSASTPTTTPSVHQQAPVRRHGRVVLGEQLVARPRLHPADRGQVEVDALEDHRRQVGR